MKNLIIILILTFKLSANSQILLKGEDVFGHHHQPAIISSPNNEWVIINTFNPKIGDNDHQKAYLLNKNGEKKNEFIGSVFLGFSLDSKTVIVQDLIHESVKELSMPDLKIISELSFKDKIGKTWDECFWYLPKKNKLIVAKSEHITGSFEDAISLELWDWQSKKPIQKVSNSPFLRNIMEIKDGQISMDNEKILLSIVDSKNEEVKYRGIILETSMLKLISTLDLTSLDDQKQIEAIYSIKLSEKGDRIFSNDKFDFDPIEKSYTQNIYSWDCTTGKLLKNMKTIKNILHDFFINENDEIIAIGMFNTAYNHNSSIYEIIRKWDPTFKNILNIHRESLSNTTTWSISNNGDIYIWDKQSKILTPFNIKTWSKGKVIKL